MSWFLRGVQSAVFHYASCAPCTGYTDSRKRRRAANKARKLKEKLQLEHPETYHHPEPTGTNPYWDEEIRMGPGPPPRKARRANTNGSRGITTAGTQSSALSKGGSSMDTVHPEEVRLSDDTLGDDNWNRKRYQREDEDLWGIHDDPPSSARPTTAGSSVGVAGFHLKRPVTSRSASYYSVRAPPVNELHPPVVSLPSPDPLENRWMLQPPPKASVMAGKERASNRSRSGSGASSRVELSLQRQLSTKKVQHKLDRGETPELPSISRASSYNNLVSGQRHEQCRTPQARPPSASSSQRKKRRDTAMTRTETTSSYHSFGASSETVGRGHSSRNTCTNPDVKVIRVRQSRPILSTVTSNGSREHDSSLLSPYSADRLNNSDENFLLQNPAPAHYRHTTYSSTQSTDSMPYLMKHRAPLSSSDISSLNRLQELVSPGDLVKSRFVSAPLIEAKIKLPPSDTVEEVELRPKHSFQHQTKWTGSGFSVSRGWGSDEQQQPERVPFDNLGVPVRDPRLRWSVDF